MSVNVSPRQIRAPGFVATVTDILARTGVCPSELCLEVTESVLMADPLAAIEVLEALRALGVKIAVDDFGTGYSSLAYVRRFPIDVLKIDRAFVRELGAETKATAIVATLVQLARALDLAIVAEGVETNEQRVQLDGLGCSLAQGFLWSRPAAVDELEPWLDALALGEPPTIGEPVLASTAGA
jgi:EAL domain-containing protein (putative c-di-GMP-specific phosphodiesterase class I)